jgi:hypothetical protein
MAALPDTFVIDRTSPACNAKRAAAEFGGRVAVKT